MITKNQETQALAISVVDLVANYGLTLIPHTYDSMTTVEHDSLVIWPTTNTWSWFSKDYRWCGPIEWLKFVEHVTEDELDEILKDIDITNFRIPKPEPKYLLDFPIGHRRYTEYMKGRNISEETAETFGLESYMGDVLVPMYDHNGLRCGSLLRVINTNHSSLKYRKLLVRKPLNLWPYFLVKQRFDKPVFIFEGTWSAMRWYQVSKGAIAPLSYIGINANAETIEILSGVRDVVFVLDNDKNDSGQNVKKRLKSHNHYPGEILNWKFFTPKTYPDEMSDEEILWYLEKLT